MPEVICVLPVLENARVLVIGFNRPDLLVSQLNRLIGFGLKVENIYVSIDGPRSSRDVDDVAQCRSVVVQAGIPSQNQRFLHSNLGCRDGVRSAIDWFFSIVDVGFILEDDCIPCEAFFRFCLDNEDSLKLSNIFSISGSSPHSFGRPGVQGPYLSSVPLIWGWFTNRDNWNSVVFDKRVYVGSLPKLMQHYKSFLAPFYFLFLASLVRSQKLNTWDVDVVIWAGLSQMYCIAPSIPLVSNVGGGDAATNTLSENPLMRHPLPSMEVDQVFREVLDRSLVRAPIYSASVHLPRSWRARCGAFMHGLVASFGLS